VFTNNLTTTFVLLFYNTNHTRQSSDQ